MLPVRVGSALFCAVGFSSCIGLPAQLPHGYTGHVVREHSRAPVAGVTVKLMEHASPWAFMQGFTKRSNVVTDKNGFFAIGEDQAFNPKRSFFEIMGSSRRPHGSRLPGGGAIYLGSVIHYPVNWKSGKILLMVPEDFRLTPPSPKSIRRMIDQLPASQAEYRRAEKFRRKPSSTR